MKTVADLMSYISTYSKSTGIWFQLANLWTQATRMYCEKVTLAKNDGQYASSNFTDEDSLTLPAYTIHFGDFKKACDDLAHKRVSVKFQLQVSCCTFCRIFALYKLNHVIVFSAY